MSKYPEVINEGVLARNAHISNAEIERDIADTEAEIAREQARAEAQRVVADNTSGPERRMAAFRADAYAQGVEERKAFVAFLRRLQDARQAVPLEVQ